MKVSTHSTDAELIASALQGIESAYTMLMVRHRPAVTRKVRAMVESREDAEDLTMEAFGKAFRALHTYGHNYAFSTWLYKIAINHCIDHNRKIRFHADIETQYHLHCDTPHAENTIIRQETESEVRAMVDRLEPKFRMMIALRYFDEMSYGEITKKLNVPLAKVKADLFRAKVKLRAQWS